MAWWLSIGAELVAHPHEPVVHFSVRTAQPTELWELADMHCATFYPTAGFLCGPLLRLDRFLALQVSTCACLPMPVSNWIKASDEEFLLSWRGVCKHALSAANNCPLASLWAEARQASART